MKKIFLLLAVMISIPLWSLDQFSGWCEVGNKTVNVGSGLASTTKVQQSYPYTGNTGTSCKITVYTHGTSSPLPTIYSDNNGSPTVLANPFYVNSDGSYQFFADQGRYDVVGTVGATTIFTVSNLSLFDPTNATVTVVGGTIDDTPIGSVTPSSGSFTSLTANYNLGVAPVGGSHYLAAPFYLTWTGNASGDSDVIGWNFDSTCGGSNNMDFCAGGRFNATYTGSGDLADRFMGGIMEATHNGTGTLNLMYGEQVRLAITNTGGIAGPSGFMANYVSEVPAWTGSGTVPDLYGFYFKDPGNASTVPGHVTNEIYGHACTDITMTIPNRAACYFSGITSGTNKWNLYIDGTASNWIRAATGFGNFPTAGDQVDVGGMFRVQGLELNSSGTYGEMMFNASSGFTSNARRFLVTNAVLGNAFAIIRSVDSNTDPTLNTTTGQITSGTADLSISVNGVVSIPNLTPTALNFANLADSAAAPTISSGFGTSPAILNSNGTTAFRIDVGTGGTASSGVVGMPEAQNGWNCFVNNLTSSVNNRADNTRQTASSTTTVTVQNQTTSTGAALAWTASDTLTFICRAF